jgi:hypothetical protein
MAKYCTKKNHENPVSQRSPRQFLLIGHGFFDKITGLMKTASTKYCLVRPRKSRNRRSGLNKWFVTNKSALFLGFNSGIPFLTRILGNIYGSSANKAQWLRQAALKRVVLLRDFPPVCSTAFQLR